MFQKMKERFQKAKEIFFGPEPEPSELAYDKETKNFPSEYAGKEVPKEEFRRILEEQRPKEIYARYYRVDDLGPHGTFYIHVQDGSVIRVSDYYPIEDAEGNITKTSNPISILDNLPYREILGKFNQNRLPMYFKAKYILKDQTAT